MNHDNARKVPADAPTDFIKPRWQKLVLTDTGIDRRYIINVSTLLMLLGGTNVTNTRSLYRQVA